MRLGFAGRAGIDPERIQVAWNRGIDLVAGLPEVIRPGRFGVTLRQTAREEYGDQLIWNIEFNWTGGTWATYVANLDETQDLGVPFFPCPSWGWISWAGPLLLVEADRSSCEFAEHRACRFSFDLGTRPIDTRETWVFLARAITEGRVIDEVKDWYDEADSDLLTDAVASGQVAEDRIRPPNQRLRPRLRSPIEDARSLIRAAERGEDLVTGLSDDLFDLEADSPGHHRARFLVAGVPYDARVSISYPSLCTFRIARISAASSLEDGFEGWASFAARSPLLVGFEDLDGHHSGWFEATKPDPVTEDDADDEVMSPAWLVAVLRTLVGAHDGQTGRRWVFAR